MPLMLNVGLSKKVGEPNYGSRGASVNVEMELESSLVADTPRLRERIRQLFDVVRSSLSEELNGHNNGSTSANRVTAEHNGQQGIEAPRADGAASSRSPTSAANGNAKSRLATQSQIMALYAITKSQGIDLAELVHDRFRVGHAEELTLKDASSLIDELKRKE